MFRRRAIASAVAAGAVATLVAILVVLGAGALLLVPSLVWLLILVQRAPSRASTALFQRLFANAYLVVAMPPSTGMTAPVTYAPARLAR
jgi:hypothetical protein